MSRIEKLFSKVNRRSSDTSVDPIANTPVLLSPNSSNINRGNNSSLSPDTGSLRNRAKSLSLVSSHNNNSTGLSNVKSNDSNASKTTRHRSKSVSRKLTKELIKYETQQVILKKLSVLLNELGLQRPIPLKIDHSNSSSLSKNIKIYVANSNNCIYLAPASSASFTYEDVENGGVSQNNTNHQDIYNNINENENDDENSNSNSHGSSLDNPLDHDHDESELEVDEDDPLHRIDHADLNSQSNKNPTIDNIPPQLRQKLESFNSPSYLSSNIDSDTPIPHTFGVIVELNKDTSINNIKFEFSSLTNILWPSGDPYNKSFTKEKFKIGKLDWVKNLKNADFYLNNLNSHDFKSRKINPDELAKRTRYYKLNNVKDLAKNRYNTDNIDDDDITSSGISHEDSEEFYDNNSEDHEICKAGVYLFLLPLLLPEHIPPTITSISGSLSHLLNISIHKNSDKLNRKLKLLSNFNLPMVRTPPSFANSIADKPIYVNRVWNDSLHYIITFPRKYVSLGSEHSINVKIVPLVKDVIIKRIKFNVLERITYVSKDLSREYDYDGEDPYYLRPMIHDNKLRERVVSICELKTKNKPSSGYSEPYKEEVIKCPDNNLLFSCYELDSHLPIKHDDDIENFKLDSPSHHARLHERSRSKENSPSQNSNNGRKNTRKNDNDSNENVMVASPLDINIALPFLTTKNDKIIQTSNNEEDLKNLSSTTSPHASRKASIMSTDNSSFNSQNYPPSSPIIGALETNLSHNHSDLLNNPEDEDFLTPDSSALIHELSHNNTKENIQHGFTTIGRALYPDSNFRHIQIYHRLQVCFRISKPDPDDHYKMHHYEVVVDTPLILLSSNCNEDSIQLPKYDELNSVAPPNSSSMVNSPSLNPLDSPSNTGNVAFRTPNYTERVGHSVSQNGQVQGNGFSIKPWSDSENLPSFEEATYSLASPITRSFSVSEDPLSRIPSISIDNGDGNPLSLNQFPDLDPHPPAYEDEVGEHGNTTNIDAIVNQNNKAESESTTNLRASKLRSSLVNSFAPSMVPASSISPTNSISLETPQIQTGNSSRSNKDIGKGIADDSATNDEAISNEDGTLENSESTSTSDSSGIKSDKSRLGSQVSLDSSNPLTVQKDSKKEVPLSFGSMGSFVSSNNSGNLPDTSSTAFTTEDENHSKSEAESFKKNEHEGGLNNDLESKSINETQGQLLPESMQNLTIDEKEDQMKTFANASVSNENVAKNLDEQPANDTESIGSKKHELYNRFNDSEISFEDGDYNEVPTPLKNKFTNLPDDSESNVSINTHGSSSYHQRIPLLRNASTESSITLAKQPTITNQNKQSADDLSIITENNQTQDIYHAY